MCRKCALSADLCLGRGIMGQGTPQKTQTNYQKRKGLTAEQKTKSQKAKQTKVAKHKKKPYNSRRRKKENSVPNYQLVESTNAHFACHQHKNSETNNNNNISTCLQ